MSSLKNITGKVVLDSGMKLMEGLETYNTFPLVTDAKTWISKNVRIRLSSSATVNIDYLSNYSHISQFSISSGTLMTDGSNYNNNFVARGGQMVAPVQCYLKSVIGFINPASCSECDPFTIVISIWKKPTNAPGTANTAVGLLFQQEITTLAAGNSYCDKIDGTTDVRVGDSSYTVDAGEGIIVSVRWRDDEGEGRACCNINADLEMTFETIPSQITTEDITLPTLSTNGFKGLSEVISTPNRAQIGNNS